MDTDDASDRSSQLKELIAAAIANAGGWISFEEFMDMALHQPGLGYYASGAMRIGRQGDFVTAAEISPLYARALARFVASSLPTGGALLELGGGTGKLMAGVLAELGELGCEPAAFMVETSPAMNEVQRQTLQDSGRLEQCSWLSGLPENFTGVVIANEVLDALACRVLARRGDTWRVKGVALRDGELCWQDGPEAEAKDQERLAALEAPAEGYALEINRRAEALVTTLVEKLACGTVLLIDYGYARSELYNPHRSSGTLTAIRRHQVTADPLAAPGDQDITAHLDCTALAQAAAGAGAEVAGFTTQAAFLMDLGITEMVDENLDLKERAMVSQQLQTLLMPHEMGEIFKVMALTRNHQPPLPGFGMRNRAAELV